MFEPRDETQARRLCRIYLKLFEAGPSGASVDQIDTHGPADMMDRRGYGDDDLARGLLDDKLLDRVGLQGGVPTFALPPMMRTCMSREISPGFLVADRLRELLTQADRAEEVDEGAFRHFEHEIRTGPW